jgi:hypothetical protein
MLSKPVLSPEQKARLASTAALKNGQCRCGHAKQTGMAFCYGCWQQLPMNIRRALYQRVGQGFEAAYAGACEYLQLGTEETLNG